MDFVLGFVSGFDSDLAGALEAGFGPGAGFEGVDELLPVLLGLVGVGYGEFGNGVVEALRSADVAGEHGWISAAGVAAGEHLAADAGVAQQVGDLYLGDVDGGFMVVELADEVVAAVDRGPAEEWVGLDLHGAFAFDDPASLMVGRDGFPPR